MKHARRQAREVALQALYAWQFRRRPARGGALERRLREDRIPRGPGARRRGPGPRSLEQLIAPHLDRDFQALSPVERAILYIGAYELAHHPKTPFKVVLNEAVEPAKLRCHGGYRFVNGVLEKVATQLRPEEVGRWRNRA